MKTKLLLLAGLTLVACKTPAPAGSSLRDDENNGPNIHPPAPGASTGQHPPGYLDPGANQQLWSKYCKGGQDVGETMNPNYDDADVAKAAKILSIVKPASFKLYADMMKMHETPPPAATTGVTKAAHNFLTYLCGEFRDRAPMIKAKLDWVFNIRYVANGGTESAKSCEVRNDPLQELNLNAAIPPMKPFDRKKSPWQQMCIEDYRPYLEISRAVFDHREATIRGGGAQLEMEDGQLATGAQKIGTVEGIDRHVPGYTACETKYIFAEYVKKKKKFVSGNSSAATAYKKYMTGYKAFKAGCSADDLAWYYDFRGDSNYKPNSPEGNAMIWMGRVAAAQCANRTTAKPGMAMKDADCRKYYENPFRSRYMAARAGLGAWLLHDRPLEPLFGSPSGSYYTIVNHAHNNPADVFSQQGPFLFRVNDQFAGEKLAAPGEAGSYLQGFEAHWGKPDLGIVQLVGLQGEAAQQNLYERLRNAVDRHTNWYKSGYDSAPSLPLNHPARRTINQAFSPFVASSYEMSESDNFTQCGLTIPCSGNNPDFLEHKQWMFIFKVKKENWYRPEDIAAGKVNPDFDRIWLDETSFGDDGLANRERAWDRLGTPMEDEHAEILYLWRIPSGN